MKNSRCSSKRNVNFKCTKNPSSGWWIGFHKDNSKPCTMGLDFELNDDIENESTTTFRNETETDSTNDLLGVSCQMERASGYDGNGNTGQLECSGNETDTSKLRRQRPEWQRQPKKSCQTSNWWNRGTGDKMAHCQNGRYHIVRNKGRSGKTAVRKRLQEMLQCHQHD